MKKGFTILAMLFVAIFVATQAMMLPSASYERRAARSLAEPDSADVEAVKADSAADTISLPDSASVGDSALLPDTAQMDSLQLAVYRHNKAIDDSIRADSLNRQKKNSIEAPVVYTANDSIVYDAVGKKAYLYGESTVKYQNMDLASDRISINLDSNIVHATGSYTDSTETEIKGKPVFQMGQDTYDSDTMSMNFKTKKGLIGNVRTEQEDGFLFSERSKRNEKGDFFLEHGRYTTCDAEHPDFYIALSRARVRPGKDVVFGPAHLVVADVHLPLAIPYGFFPFSKSYSSGFIMPTYGDESARGFYLRDGGYYFAISDKMDLKLLGEIYTKGSWGISAASNYRRRYRHSGGLVGLKRCEKADLEGGTPEENAAVTRGILSGEVTGPKRDAVLLNAGAALFIAGKTDSLAGGISMAAQLIEDGSALRTLETYIRESNEGCDE